MTATNYAKKARLLITALMLAAVLLFPLAVYADGGEDASAPDTQQSTADTTAADDSGNGSDSTSTETEAPASEINDIPESESTDDNPVAEEPSEEVVDTPELDSDGDLPDEDADEAEAGEFAEATAADDSASDQTDCVEEDAAQVAGGDDAPAALEDGEEGQEAASDSDGVGNSYVAEITPDAVVKHDATDNYEDGQGNDIPNAGESADFTVTFTEVGSDVIGSVQVKIPTEFSNVSFNADWEPDNINTSGDQQWEGKLDGAFIYLRALNGAFHLGNGEWVEATFTATTPAVTGRYEFETKAWTDNAVQDSTDLDPVTNDPVNKNNMAAGYSNPVVIVGKPVANHDGFEGGVSGSGHYVQVGDIDLTTYPSWSPIGAAIGTDGDPVGFSGSYHGNGYKIENMTIEDTQAYRGLFGYVDGAWIGNVNLVDVDVTGGEIVGGLVGFSEDSIIINSSVEGSVNGEGDVGGLVGKNVNGVIINSWSTSTVKGLGSNKAYNIGGLVGWNEDSVIVNSRSTGDVSGRRQVGGLVGNNRPDSTIVNSDATGNVNGSANRIGGLVGINHGTIIDSRALSEVQGNNEVGGLVGRNPGDITESHATGKVEGNDEVGGLAGYNVGDITESSASGAVTGDSWVGGLAGYNFGGNITNSYATGNVTGDKWVGGLVGYNSFVIRNSYATGVVTGNPTGTDQGNVWVGGLVGRSGGNITNSFFDSTINSDSALDKGFGVAKTTTELQTLATFVDAGWLIIGEDGTYPVLLWQLDAGNEVAVNGAPPIWHMGGDPGFDPDSGLDPETDLEPSPGFTPGPFRGASMRPILMPVPRMSSFAVLDAYLVLPLSEGVADAYSLIDAGFVTNGTPYDLQKAVMAYTRALLAHEVNAGTMTDKEYALDQLDLSAAWAAILILEVKLSSDKAALNAAIEAYRDALSSFGQYGGVLNEVQLTALLAVLNAIEGELIALGAQL